MIRRRPVLLGLLAAVPATALADDDVNSKRLQNRLDLWGNYAKRTKNLLARVTTTRETSLLSEPLHATGSVAFRAPATLALLDDGLDGSTTWIDGRDLELLPNQTSAPRIPPISREGHPAAAWIADRLVRMFAPGEGNELIVDARTNVPRGRGYRLALMPPRATAVGSRIRKKVRSITLHLDPVAGAVTQIIIAEAQGDVIRLQLSDHRQNVDEADIDAAFEQVAKLRRR